MAVSILKMADNGGVNQKIERQKKVIETETSLRHVLEEDEIRFGPDHPKVATSLNNLADYYARHRKYDLAEPMFVRALTILENSYGKDHPYVATVLENYGFLLGETGQADLASEYFARAERIKQKSTGKIRSSRHD